MAIWHGNKTYMQILLDPHRAKLLFDLAEKAAVRPTAWVRNAVYKTLEREYPSAIYNEAVAKDEAVWRASVRKRVEGRIKSRKASEDFK
jgi:hypothetical protein|tara:strand:+ start:554 stop:820 length:267 start_codon:yes stop_codon:yes gene_type:complete